MSLLSSVPSHVHYVWWLIGMDVLSSLQRWHRLWYLFQYHWLWMNISIHLWRSRISYLWYYMAKIEKSKVGLIKRKWCGCFEISGQYFHICCDWLFDLDSLQKYCFFISGSYLAMMCGKCFRSLHSRVKSNRFMIFIYRSKWWFQLMWF